MPARHGFPARQPWMGSFPLRPASRRDRTLFAMAATCLFVYGTLKRGGRRHHLLANQEILGAACTLPIYKLYDCGNHPCLVEDRAGGRAVQGEVWRVSETVLARLDAYEDVPQLFQRRAICLAEWSEPVIAYLYQGPLAGLADAGACWSQA